MYKGKKDEEFESYYDALGGDPMAMLEEANKELESFNSAIDGQEVEDEKSYCDHLIDELNMIEMTLLPPGVRPNARQIQKTLAAAKAMTQQAALGLSLQELEKKPAKETAKSQQAQKQTNEKKPHQTQNQQSRNQQKPKGDKK